MASNKSGEMIGNLARLTLIRKVNMAAKNANQTKWAWASNHVITNSHSTRCCVVVLIDIIIDSFHIVSAHAPNCLVPRYLRKITLEGATFIRLPIRYTMEYGKDEKKNKFTNED